MLHELLFALKGHCGGVFQNTPHGIKVVQNLPFIHESEVAILNELCQIGTLYKSLVDFIQHYGTGLLCKKKPESDDLYGLYLKCLCQGLDSVLQDYREILMKLEQDVLHDAHLPISHIACHLQEFHILFPILSSSIEQIVTHKAHGCYILDILYKNAVYGVPMVKNALNRILHQCYGLLFKQLSSWMLYGITSDPYNEFFLQKATNKTVAKEGPIEEGDSEDDLGIMGLTGKQLQKVFITPEEDKVATDMGRYVIAADLLPSFIPIRVANKILFIGESVKMCDRDKQKTHLQASSIMSTHEHKFASDLQELSKQKEFNVIGFETVIDKIRAHAAEYLWVLVVEQSDLSSELKIVKDFLLLGRGELYLTFIDQAQHLLRTPPTSTTEHDVNRSFQQSARDVLLDNEALIQRFHLTVPYNKKGTSETSSTARDIQTGWSMLGIQYVVPWPLNVLFTSTTLNKYNKVFKFLLAVRKTQLDLQHCWSLQMNNKKLFTSPSANPTQQLRTHMAFLVDNLQYYIQVDVIESQYKILMDKINSTKDFEVAKLAHEHFVTSLLAQSFVHVKSVSSCLNEILNQCSLFCRLLVSGQTDKEKETEQLQHIKHNFQQYSSLLFRILSGVRSQSAHPHLAQLLLRLDFNKFFTNMGGQLGRAFEEDWQLHLTAARDMRHMASSIAVKLQTFNVTSAGVCVLPVLDFGATCVIIDESLD